MTLKQLKRKYFTEGIKFGYKKALNEGWNYRRGDDPRWAFMAPNRFNKKEWTLIKHSFVDATDEALEMGDDSLETIAYHWQQFFIDMLIDDGISPRRLRNGAREIANYFVQTRSDIGILDRSAKNAGDTIYDALKRL